jgi:hypothetical protein
LKKSLFEAKHFSGIKFLNFYLRQTIASNMSEVLGSTGLKKKKPFFSFGSLYVFIQKLRSTPAALCLENRNETGGKKLTATTITLGGCVVCGPNFFFVFFENGPDSAKAHGTTRARAHPVASCVFRSVPGPWTSGTTMDDFK